MNLKKINTTFEKATILINWLFPQRCKLQDHSNPHLHFFANFYFLPHFRLFITLGERSHSRSIKTLFSDLCNKSLVYFISYCFSELTILIKKIVLPAELFFIFLKSWYAFTQISTNKNKNKFRKFCEI